MDPIDHRDTSSNGSSLDAKKYRDFIERLLKNGEWRKALAMDIWDVNSISGRKYNQEIKEMLLYFKCVKKNNLLQ